MAGETRERTAFKVGAADGLMTASISHAQRVCRRYLKHFTGLFKYNIIQYKTMVLIAPVTV